jgi:pyruvate dehydrogenase E2 component (dihydrolipoamide acetyltransferase)
VFAEVATDKAVVDLPAPPDGVIRELHAEVGEMVPVGDVMVTTDVDGVTPQEESVTGGEVDTSATDGTTADAAETVGEIASVVDAEVSTDGERVFAPANVRRLARTGSERRLSVGGAGSRVTKILMTDMLFVL